MNVRGESAGYGDRMISLLHTWWAAVVSNRILVVDWRKNTYLENDGTNLFELLFKPIDVIKHPHCDVKVLTDVDIDYPKPIKQFSPDTMLSDFACGDTPTITVWEHITNCSTTHSCWGPNVLPRELHEHFLSHFKMVDEWDNMFNEYYQENMADKPTIGVLIRHGNGETGAFAEDKRAIKDFSSYCEHITGRIREIGSQYDDYNVYMTTDSIVAVAEMRKHIPDILWREQWMPPVGTGPLHFTAKRLAPDPLRVAADGLISMYLLSMCHDVISQPKTFFTLLAEYINRKPNLHLI